MTWLVWSSRGDMVAMERGNRCRRSVWGRIGNYEVFSTEGGRPFLQDNARVGRKALLLLF